MMADGCPLLSAAAAGSGADCLAFLALLILVAAPPGAESTPDYFAKEEDDLVSRTPRLRSLIDTFSLLDPLKSGPATRPKDRVYGVSDG